MTKQVTRMAGAVVAGTSRRGFLGRLARLAGGAAAAAGLWIASATHANARNSPGKPQKQCCYYLTDWGSEIVRCVNSKELYGACPWDLGPGTYLVGSKTVGHCREC